MPSAVTTSPASLAAARSDVEQVHTALTAAVADVTADVTSLVGAGWRGTAAAAFGEGFDEWRRGAERVLEALAASAVALPATRRAYVASDETAADAFARLDGRLGSR